jgi:hypothetical protein
MSLLKRMVKKKCVIHNSAKSGEDSKISLPISERPLESLRDPNEALFYEECLLRALPVALYHGFEKANISVSGPRPTETTERLLRGVSFYHPDGKVLVAGSWKSYYSVTTSRYGNISFYPTLDDYKQEMDKQVDFHYTNKVGILELVENNWEFFSKTPLKTEIPELEN